jgi:short-subunit dehydrogenase
MSYGVAKAGVVMLSEQLRAELHGSGVRVGVICPAFFRTNLVDTAIADDRTKARIVRLMEKSPDTVDTVADKVFAAAERGEFLIIPTRREPMLWRMKRWLPGVYFKMLLKMSRKRTG